MKKTIVAAAVAALFAGPSFGFEAGDWLFKAGITNVDPKSDESVEPLAAVIQRTGALDRVCVGSFSDRRIADLVRRLGPDLCTSLGPRAVARQIDSNHAGNRPGCRDSDFDQWQSCQPGDSDRYRR